MVTPMPAVPPAGPLSGYLILDLSRVLSGPYCTMILRDLGARVIKVEEPGGGDEARHFLPLGPDGLSAYFTQLNRGKESIALNLKQTADQQLFEQLLARADVLVENFRPGVLAQLGYAPAALLERFPTLVIASISGFGQTGPYRQRAAYDVVVQAMSGLMSVTGHAGAEPTRAGTSIGDLGAALFACNGIQAALLQRCRTGRGAHVDVAMMEAQIALLEGAIPHWWAHGAAPGPIGARHPGAAPFDAFRVADGHVVIAAGSDHLFARLLQVLQCPALAGEARFASRAARVEHHAALKALLETQLSAQPASHWLGRLEEAGVPAGPLNDVPAMLSDPQVVARGAVVPLAGTAGQQAAVTPILMTGYPYPTVLPPAPALNQHRAAILQWLADAPGAA